jgi:hypothetical protein
MFVQRTELIEAYYPINIFHFPIAIAINILAASTIQEAAIHNPNLKSFC